MWECRRDITVKALKHCGKIYWKKIKSQFDKKKKRIYRNIKKRRRKEKIFTCETPLRGERAKARPENLFITFWFVVVVFITTTAMLHSFVIIMAWEWVRRNEEWKKINKNVDAAGSWLGVVLLLLLLSESLHKIFSSFRLLTTTRTNTPVWHRRRTLRHEHGSRSENS